MKYENAIALFAAALDTGADDQVPVLEATRANLGFYRGNVIANRSSALAAAFPTVRELVGAAYFTALAEAYIRVISSTSGNLHDDGSSFADFIAQFAPAADLPFLPDVARLDWAMHCAHFATDAPVADLTPLQTLDPDGFGQVCLTLHPAVSVVASANWPIHAIYAMHHGAAPADLNAGAQNVLVWRDEIRLLEGASPVFVQALLAGLPIDHAAETTWQHDADFDPGPTLALLFGSGLVTALVLPALPT